MARLHKHLWVLLTLWGCTHQPKTTLSEEAFKKEVFAYKGKAVQEVIDFYGYPQRQFEGPEGNDVYEYQFAHMVTTPLYAYQSPYSHPFPGFTEVLGGETFYYSCFLWFELDKEKKVAGVRWRGNFCLRPQTPKPVK